MRSLPIAVATALLAASIACGTRGPTAPGGVEQQPPQSPPAPVPIPIPQPARDTVPASSDGVPGVYRGDVVMPYSGTTSVILRWPDADYSLQLYVTSGACGHITDLLRGACTVLGKTRPGDLPGMVTSRVSRGDVATIWVLNTDAAPKSFTLAFEFDE